MAYADFGLRIEFWGDEIESIGVLDLINMKVIEEQEQYVIFPANIFVTAKEDIKRSIFQIQDDLMKQVEYFNEIGDEADVVIKEINGPSWSRKPKQSLIDDTQKDIKNNGTLSQLEIMKSNANSIKAVAMIRSYRQRGHLIAKLDPLGLLKADYLEELHPESYGFKKEDYQIKTESHHLPLKLNLFKRLNKFLSCRKCLISPLSQILISRPPYKRDLTSGLLLLMIRGSASVNHALYLSTLMNA